MENPGRTAVGIVSEFYFTGRYRSPGQLFGVSDQKNDGSLMSSALFLVQNRIFL
jgi:hypothetical protein